MEYYGTLERVIEATSPKEKIALFEQFWDTYRANNITYLPSSVKIFECPSYGTFCTIVPPKDVPQRKRLSTVEGRQLFLHAILHIEYSAIDLALDAAYRFLGAPKAFYDDWLTVAADEIRHFSLLGEIAQQWGFEYGDFEVHSALFEAGAMTSHSLLERMAIVPRFMEANGLDANPKLKEKLRSFQEIQGVSRLLEILDIILYDEIEHVKKGTKWLNYALTSQLHNPDNKGYFTILEHYFPKRIERNVSLNVLARKEAGFSCEEIVRLGAKTCD